MINDQTMVPLGIACAVFLFGLMCVRWLDSRLNRMENAISKALTDRWTKTDHRIWALELSMLNKDIKLPDIHNVHDQQQEFLFAKD